MKKDNPVCLESFKILTLQGGMNSDPLLRMDRLSKCRSGKIVSNINATQIRGAGEAMSLPYMNTRQEASLQH